MKRFILLILGVLALSGIRAQNDRETLLQLQKFTQFYNYLTRTYIDTVNTSQVVEDAIVKALSELDPHSSYISAKDMKRVNEEFDASFEGIGIEFNVLNDTVIVINTIAGGPAESVGMLPNDRIVMVGDSVIVGITTADVPLFLKGPKGSTVDVKVVRRGVQGMLDFHIVRDKLPINTVEAAYRIDSSTGYIKINRFAATTNDEFQDGLKKLGDIDALIVDLRGNGGGFMDQAVDVSSNFLTKGSLVTSMEGRSIPPQKFDSSGSTPFERGKLVILVDEFSASASEIVAGAVQDWDRGLVVGRPTFGKGLVQRQFPLVDGSAVRITMARYHTPSGRVIQRPFEKGKTEEYYADFARRITSDSLTAMPDSLKYKTLRSGRTVYGGGGITPDIIVPRDTTYHSDYRAAIIRAGVITEFVIEYIAAGRERLTREYPTFGEFDARFTVGPEIMKGLTDLASKRGIEYDGEGFERSEKEIAIQLKALIAQKLWSTEEYLRIVNGAWDPEVEKALEIIAEWDKYGNGIFI